MRAYIGNTTDILTSPNLGRMIQQKGIQKCNQRTSLSPVRLISNSELRNRRLSRPRSNNSCLSHIQVRSELVALEHLREREMPDSNSVRSNEIDVFVDVDIVLFAELECCSSELFAEEVVYL